jgi:hypothetical protein
MKLNGYEPQFQMELPRPLPCEIIKRSSKYFFHHRGRNSKSSEILSIFQVFPCTTQIALFWPKLLPALFLKP